jgi:hypothetical protein
MNVPATAIPTEAPVLRIRLKSPEALPTRAGGTDCRAAADSGTNVNPMPKPWMSDGHTMLQKLDSVVKRDISKLPSATNVNPAARMSRVSIFP